MLTDDDEIGGWVLSPTWVPRCWLQPGKDPCCFLELPEILGWLSPGRKRYIESYTVLRMSEA